MKYNSKNTPLVCMQTNSTCYKGTTRLPEIKGVLWHSTGANNTTLKRYVQPSDNAPDKEAMLKILGKNAYRNDWNHITRYAGMNAWIGKLADGTVAAVQTMPWNFKPWGCGSGPKGSCNDGWLQFEICEDGLNDINYFNKVYKEACELTAYLCTMFNLNPKGTATHKGVTVPVILCHQDSYRLGLGGNHADVLHWFPKFGKTMEDVRNDVAALMKTGSSPSTTPTSPTTKEYFRVRKTWNNADSQIGAYLVLNTAIEACQKAGTEYSVFDNSGKKVYPEEKISEPSKPTATNNLSKLYIGYASKGDIVTLEALVNGLGISTSTSNGYITTGYASKGDQTTIFAKCEQLGVECRIYEGQTIVTPTPSVPQKGMQAKDLISLSSEQIVAKVGPLFTKDQEKTGVLAAVSMAQFILESSYGKSELAQNANNCFGMKKSLSGNTWSGSKWDGTSVYVKSTAEHTGTEYININAAFRKYPNIEDSIEDHSAYLIGAKNGSKLRYAELKGETDYKKAAQIIKNGGYATSPTYVENLCKVIEKWDLTKYNASSKPIETPTVPEIPSNAKFNLGDCVKLAPGATYINGKTIPAWVFNNKLYVRAINGNQITFSTLKSGAITGVTKDTNLILQDVSNSREQSVNYLVKITANLLNVRAGAGTEYPVNTTIRNGGVYTIVAEDNGWGKLKSGAGWINLKYARKVS